MRAMLLSLALAAAAPAQAAGVSEVLHGLLHEALRDAASSAGLLLEPGRTSGSPLTELVFEGFSLEGEGFRLSVPRGTLSLDWRQLRKRAVVIRRLGLERPTLTLKADGGRKAKPKAKTSRWTFAVQGVLASDVTVAWGGEPSQRRLIRSLALSYEKERVEVASAVASLGRTTLALNGSFDIPAVSGRAEARLSGEVSGRARVSGSGKAWRASGEGRWRGAAWEARVSLAPGKRWETEAGLKGLKPGQADAAWLDPWGPQTWKLSARGKDWAPGKALADASLRGVPARGPALAATARLEAGTASWTVRLSSAGFSGELAGKAELGTGRLSASLQAEAAPQALSGLAAVEHGRVFVRASSSGTLKAPEWQAQAGAERVVAADWLVRSATAQVSGLGLGVSSASLTLAGAGRRAGPGVLERLDFSVNRRQGSYETALDAVVAGTTVAARGFAERTDGVARTKWERLDIMTDPAWNAEPFELEAGPGLLKVRSLRLRAGPARVSLDAFRSQGRWERLALDVSGVALGKWAALAGLNLPLQGTAALHAEAAGEGSLSGRATLEIPDASIGGVGPGPLRGRAELEGGVLRVTHLGWEPAFASVTVRGRLEVDEKLKPGDFEAGLTVSDMGQGMDLSVDAFKVEGLKVVCDAGVSRRKGVVKASGQAELEARSAAWPAAGLSLEDIAMQLKPEGEALVVERASATSSGKTLELAGRVGLKGPDLRLKAERLVLAPREGFRSEAELELSLSGPWLSPKLAGRVDLEGLAYSPERPKSWWRRLLPVDWLPKKKEPEPAAAPPAGEFLPRGWAADVKVSFPRNVWYKRGALSVEVRGELVLKRERHEPLRILGEAEAVRGNASFLGRAFQVEEGRLSFAGEVPLDPGLEAAALHVDERTRTKVRLRLSGTARKPRLALSSEPPMEERDIVSLLVAGRPFEKAEPGKRTEDDAARSAAEQLLASYAARGVRETILSPLELDVFQVRLKGGRAAELRVGRYLTKDLFMIYEQTTGSSAQTRLKAEYAISPNWSVEGSRDSLGHGVLDLTFKIGLR
ncbi:MAG: translocation/assembly module TamB domain-containing protein [Elusimicrobia bacterium]|nr:translocation/assembly module TamB domain-containing protein [Elusimicrobiota bacterium]